MGAPHGSQTPALIEFAGSELASNSDRLAIAELQSMGPRLILQGNWQLLAEHLRADVPVSAGDIRILGLSAQRAVRTGRVGVSADPSTLPARWTLLEYLSAHQRLRGSSKHLAHEQALEALAAVGLRDVARTRNSKLDATSRALASLAVAVLGRPSACVIVEPVPSAVGADEEAVANAVRAIWQARPSLVLLKPSLSSAAQQLLWEADELVVRSSADLMLRGAPAELLGDAQRFLLSVLDNAGTLQAELLRRGFLLEAAETSAATVLGSSAGPDAGRFIVRVPAEGTPQDIVAQAFHSQAPLIEFVPLDVLAGKT